MPGSKRPSDGLPALDPIAGHPGASAPTNGRSGHAESGHAEGAAPHNGHGHNGPKPAPTLRREILVALRQAGPSSPDQIAARLGTSRTGVLQQLRALETAELVSRRTERHGVGRPRHLYDVTSDAQGLFPSNYDGLAAGLLAAIGAIGGDSLVEQVFDARRRQITAHVRSRLAERLPTNAPMADRVRELAMIQDEEGYLCSAEVDADGTIRLREHNCAIFEVATGTTSACRAELELFSDVLGAEIVRESHIAAGDRCCIYRVVARPD
jgi:predicted ArsR family transcriptional regulator